MKFYVYAHYTKDTNELFYIGKGVNFRCDSTSGRNIYWKRVVEKHGFIVKKLKQNISENLAFKYEMYFIKKFNPKCNLTPGGYGGDTWSTYSKEQKQTSIQKCSKAKLIYWSGKSLQERKQITKFAAQGVVKMWANMDPIAKSLEQKRRNSLKPKCPVYCINNGILYNSAKEAANALSIKRQEHIHRVANGGRPHCYGYKFQYVTSDYPTLPNGNIT